MQRWLNKVAVVTGASSGIGAAIAKDLVKSGVQVVGLAPCTKGTEELKKQLPTDMRKKLTALKCDVTDENSVNSVFDTIISQFGGVDILVNNAGCVKFGQLATMNLNDVQQVLRTNVMGVVYCTQRAFKSMHERDFAGHVILINSVGGHNVVSPPGTPEMNIYPPSKFALRAMTEIYRKEFRTLGTRVKVTSISPGGVDTAMIPANIKALVGDCLLKTEDVSASVLYAISTPPHVQIHELIIRPLGEQF